MFHFVIKGSHVSFCLLISLTDSYTIGNGVAKGHVANVKGSWGKSTEVPDVW